MVALESSGERSPALWPCHDGPAMTALLTPLRKGFLLLNRWVAAPLIRAGGGSLLTTPVAGSILLLRTTGRKSGLIREAPLGYTVFDGRVVVVARLTLGDVRGKSDAEVDTLAVAFPILAIAPTAIRPGPFDPGGIGTRINTALSVLVTAAGLGTVVWRHRSKRPEATPRRAHSGR